MGQSTMTLARHSQESPAQQSLRTAPRDAWWHDRYLVATLVLAAILSITTTWYAADNHLILLWNDAHAHLQIARRVFDNITPGVAQFGGVWLPFPHLVMLPFIWIGPLWANGLAGTIPSMIAYCVAAAYIYLFARRLTGNMLASFIGTLIFLINPNILYLQATPLSELILIATMMMACYYFLAWVQEETTIHLIQTAACTFFATLSRYDGWALFIALLVGVGLVGWQRRRSAPQIETNMLIFGALGGLGILLWFLWNTVIFGDPLYFQHSQYSSQAQQLPNIQQGLDIPYHNFVEAVRYYSIVSAQNVGPVLLILGVVALLVVLMRKSFTPIFLAAAMVFVPFGFYVVSLYSGQAIIFAPGAGPFQLAAPIYNVRYGSQMVPPVAALLPVLLTRASLAIGDVPFAAYAPRWTAFIDGVVDRLQRGLPTGVTVAQVAIVIVLAAQTSLLAVGGIITLQEGQYGIDCFQYSTVPAFMARHDNGGLILNDPFFNLQDLSVARIDFHRIVSEGAGPLWNKAIADPATVVDWVIVKPGDLVAAKVDVAAPSFLEKFTLVGADPKTGVQIFHRKAAPPLPTRAVPNDVMTNYYALCGVAPTIR